MKTAPLSEAISNNAAWCASIAAAHSTPSLRSESAWVCEQPMPPLYPNIVTLRSDANIDKLITQLDPKLPAGWAIKDSFKNLDLENKGFSAALEACWYCCDSDAVKNDNKRGSAKITNVSNPSELFRWVEAWGEKSEIFRPSLLLDKSVELLYVENNGDIVAGLATNLSGQSVGISNVFGTNEGILQCIHSIGKKHSSKTIVGYGDIAETIFLSKIGFRTIGELQIWIRSEALLPR